jgi:hypothetical protein
VSRTLKRVPMSFDWPLGQVWGGFVNPYYKLAGECPDCEHGHDRARGRPEANAALFYNQWYGDAPFDPKAYGAEPLSIDHPAVRAFAERNVKSAPDYYMTPAERRLRDEFRQAAMDGFPGDDRPLIQFPTFDHRERAIHNEIRRLHGLWIGQWSHQLIQADVDALIARARLWDFTRVPINEEQEKIVADQLARGENSWLPYPNGRHPTAAEVNAWSIGGGFGHDSLNCGICVEARCEREGVPYTCARCAGSGQIWPTPEIEKQCEDWTKTDPPAGDGYQLWATTSEGCPVSPVFGSLEELCAWAADHATTFASYKATAEEWRQMLEDDFVHAAVGNNIFT